MKQDTPKFLLACSCVICRRQLTSQILSRHLAAHGEKPYRNTCLNCGRGTNNAKFCSHSCAASHSNKISPKRTSSKKCSMCDDPVKSSKHELCVVHYQEKTSNKKSGYKLVTIGEIKARYSDKQAHPSWVRGAVRGYVRNWNKNLISLPCAKCGYDKHVELAHIDSLADLPDQTTLGEAHASTNVIQLCPNCHWEFDNLDRSNFKELVSWVKSGRR